MATDKAVRFIPKYFDTPFTDFEELKRNNRFIDWLNGKNTLTGRKINQIGKVGHEILYEILKDFYDSKEIWEGDRYICGVWNYLIKDKMDEKEFQENVNREKELVKKNELTKEIEKKVLKLKWNDFVIVNGVKYALPEVYHNVHMENDCKGKVETYSEKVDDREDEYFREWFSYTSHKKCNKCGKEFSSNDKDF